MSTGCSLYILKSLTNGKYYIGSTANLSVRLVQHNSRRSLSTKSGVPWELVYREEHPTRSAAMAREREIKSWRSRVKIDSLV